MTSKIQTLLIGGTSIGATELVSQVAPLFDINGLIQVVVQVVIGIVTIIKFFKKDKPSTTQKP